MTDAQVAVLGSGPAGLSAAAACAEAGLATVLLDPHPDRVWQQTYAAWLDELPAPAQACVRRSWDDVRVVTNDHSLRLDRTFALLDNVVLQQSLQERFRAAGGVVKAVSVTGVRSGPPSLTVFTAAPGHRGHVSARAVIDATGHRPALVWTTSFGAPAMQSAFGVVAHCSQPPATPGAMTFMDFSTSHRHSVDASPSFLYAMDLGRGKWFVEETSLAARPALSVNELETRLHSRLAFRGVKLGTIQSTERVTFPMGAALPDLAQPVIGFGAAAGKVHPATGFQVARTLADAPRLASALADGITSGAGTASVAAAGWNAVWPRDELRQRSLHALGLESLLGLNSAQTGAFFEAFFSLPDWASYTSGALHAGNLGGIMLRIFARVPLGLRLHLLRSAARNLPSQT